MNILRKIFKYIIPEPKQMPIKQEPVRYLNDIAKFDDI